MPTVPVTYRISPEVDAELKRLAKLYGGTDKALRVLLKLENELEKNIAKHFAEEPLDDSPKVVTAIRQNLGMKVKAPLLKPSEKKR
jgi:hypothetical protein